MEEPTTSNQGSQAPHVMSNVTSSTDNPVSAFHQLLAGLGSNPEQAAQYPVRQLGLRAFNGLSPSPELDKYYARKKKATALIQQYGKKPISPTTEAEYRKKADRCLKRPT